jgi:hypothetical protein
VAAHQGAHRRVRQHRGILGLPAQPAGDRGERQVLRPQASPRLEPAGDNDALVVGQDGSGGQHVGGGVTLAEHRPGQVQPADATDDGERLMAVGSESVSRVLLAVGGGQRRIQGLPSGLEESAEDGLAGGEDGGLQVVEGSGGLEGRQVGQGHLDGGQFGQQLSRQVIRAANEHAEVAHGALLG